jgi:hypothetical protein
MDQHFSLSHGQSASFGRVVSKITRRQHEACILLNCRQKQFFYKMLKTIIVAMEKHIMESYINYRWYHRKGIPVFYATHVKSKKYFFGSHQEYYTF